MPNYCFNTLHIAGDGADAASKQITEYCKENSSFIDKFIPFPEAGQRQVEGGFTVFNKGDEPDTIDGYAWAINNWGTKWPDSDTESQNGGREFNFSTPWGTPDMAMKTISKLYPDAVFTLMSIEEQPEWRCRSVFKNGRQIHEAVDFTPDENPYDYETDEQKSEDWSREFRHNFESIVSTVDGVEWELSPAGAAACADKDTRP
jgi:hypothetical protein